MFFLKLYNQLDLRKTRQILMISKYHLNWRRNKCQDVLIFLSQTYFVASQSEHLYRKNVRSYSHFKAFSCFLGKIITKLKNWCLRFGISQYSLFCSFSNSQCHKSGTKFDMLIWFGSYWILLRKCPTLFAEHIWLDVNCHVTQDVLSTSVDFFLVGFKIQNYEYSRWQVISYLVHKLDRRQVQMWARRAKSLNLSVSALMATSLACSLFSSSPWNVVEHLDEKSTEQVRR